MLNETPSPDATADTSLAAFTAKFSALVDSGLSLTEALDRLAADEGDSHFRGVIDEMRQDLTKGDTLSGAIAKHPDSFTDAYLSAICEGEEKGSLDSVLRDLARGSFTPNALLGYSDQFQDVTRAVYVVAGKYKTAHIEPEHYLLGLLTAPENDATAYLAEREVDLPRLRADVQEYLSALPRKTGTDWSVYSPALTAISDAADRIAADAGAAEITPRHFLMALARADGTEAATRLRAHGVTEQNS